MHARYKKRRNKNVYVKNEERKNEHEGKLFQCIQCGFLNKNKKVLYSLKPIIVGSRFLLMALW
jgi:hypothetical protein